MAQCLRQPSLLGLHSVYSTSIEYTPNEFATRWLLYHITKPLAVSNFHFPILDGEALFIIIIVVIIRIGLYELVSFDMLKEEVVLVVTFPISRPFKGAQVHRVAVLIDFVYARFISRQTRFLPDIHELIRLLKTVLVVYTFIMG